LSGSLFVLRAQQTLLPKTFTSRMVKASTRMWSIEAYAKARRCGRPAATKSGGRARYIASSWSDLCSAKRRFSAMSGKTAPRRTRGARGAELGNHGDSA